MSLIQKFAKGVLFSSLIGMSLFSGDSVDNKIVPSTNIPKEIFVPEYKRSLENVFMKFQPAIKYQDNLIKEVLKYSDVNFLVAESAKKEFEAFSKTLSVELNKINPVYYKSEGKIRQAWAQDMFEFLVSDKTKKVIFPSTFNSDASLDSFLNLLKTDSVNYDFSKNNFEGGHLTYDYFNGKNILFAGTRNDFINALSKGEKIINYKKEFGADTIVFFNNDSQKTPLFHIDQCFNIVDSGKVAILDLDHYSLEDFYSEKGSKLSILEKEFYRNLSSADAKGLFVKNMLTESLNYSRKMLNEMENKFNKLGYEVFSLPASFWQIANYQSYLNSRIFLDEGKGKILMPLFPDSTGKYDLNSSRNKQAREFFQSFGLEVIPIENKSWEKQGNIHCLINEI